MLIRGDQLNDRQRQQVLEAFVYRLTPSTATGRAYYHRNGHYFETDDDFINGHAFHFTKDGSRLMANRRHCEPASLAN